jgi:hypothetical protein
MTVIGLIGNKGEVQEHNSRIHRKRNDLPLGQQLFRKGLPLGTWEQQGGGSERAGEGGRAREKLPPPRWRRVPVRAIGMMKRGSRRRKAEEATVLRGGGRRRRMRGRKAQEAVLR